MKKKIFSAGYGALLLTGLLMAGSVESFAQRSPEKGGRGNRGNERGSNPGRSFENRQRDVQQNRPDRSAVMQRPQEMQRSNENRQREMPQRQEQAQRSREFQRNNGNGQREMQQRQDQPQRSREFQKNNENRQRESQQKQEQAQRSRDFQRNNDRQRDLQQRNVQERRDVNGSFDNKRFEARRDVARVNRPSYDRRPNNMRNRTYAYNYRPRYTRPPVIWGARRYYSFYNYSYHPYRPRYYGSFFHPVGFFSLRLGSAAISIALNSRTYWYDQGVYYEPYNNGYQVVTAPDGAYIRQLPYGYSTIELGGNTYYYFAGTFYATGPQGFYVTTAPPGAIVYDLPEGAEEFSAGDYQYLEYNNTVYQPITIDGRNAYEVVELDEEDGY
jgi:hypothetical protein